ncbi:MAG: hypothetical protein CL567_04165 [Alphaproteobacteria bacterium]|nr:hypothetical protein [Alphaproteobacteria bacterium]|tara:strand:+ start:86 stop:1468 length:1383 start_codon:yes stop_codon:yes gene_type:complete
MQSPWLQQALLSESAHNITPLDRDLKVDVVIVGGGYTGLWTAIELKNRDPSMDVAIIEKDICGAGASAANAGFALPMWLQLPLLEKISNTSKAIHIGRASIAAIDDIREISLSNDIDTQISHSNTIWGATCEKQSGHWDKMLSLMEAFQVHSYQVLDKHKIQQMTGSDSLIAGVIDTASIMIHPGNLVRGLRRVALNKGVRIFEKTPMTKLGRTTPPTVKTTKGKITARKVVLAMYGWSLSIPELRRSAMVMFTDAAMTVPIPDKLRDIGFYDAPGFTDSRTFIESIRPTSDGRVMLTKSGGWLPFGDRLDACPEYTCRSENELRRVLESYHPSLKDVEIEGTWCGPIDRTMDGLPTFGRLPTCPHIVFGYGYSGAGIVPSRVGSHILASLVQDLKDEWTSCPLVRPLKKDFPNEPFRWIGGHIVKSAIERKDRLDHEGLAVGPITKFWLQFTPKSYKPS